MKNTLGLISFLLSGTLLLSGCAKFKQITKPITKPITKVVGTVGAVGGALLPPYAAPKAKVTVVTFENKTAKGTEQLNTALRRSLIEALIDSNRFILVEPNIKAADLTVAVTLSEFDPRVSGGKSGIAGGGGSGNSTFGGLLGASLNKANIALDIQIVSVQEVLNTGHIQGQASDTGNLRRQASIIPAYDNTPMGKAMRLCLTEAVRYITQAIPAKYYKYY